MTASAGRATGDAAQRRRDFLREARTDPRHTLVALDVDGTVSAIASSPDTARIEREMHATLDHLSRRVNLWFISGRDTDDIRRMIGVASAGYIGGHGLEVLDQGGLRSLAPTREFRHQLTSLAQQVEADVPEAAPYVERKRWSVAFHYRALNDQPDVIDRLRRSVEAHLTPELRLEQAKMAFEARPAIEQDKGTALGWLIDTTHPRRVLIAGDDYTDVAMFRALEERRERGEVGALTVAVEGEETPRELIDVADGTVEGIWGLEHLLHELLRT